MPTMTLLGTALDAVYALARPALFRLEAERAHEVVLACLRLASASPAAMLAVRRLLIGEEDPRLAVAAFGLRFANPIGLAAGLDKGATALPAWLALGFGHVEVGTVTPDAQPGNPRPRVFRLPRERGLINRMGFPSEGADVVAQRLARARRFTRGRLVVGGNIGKAAQTPVERAVEDYVRAARTLAPHVDYLAANISSPNTVGLRQLQAPEQVHAIVSGLRSVVSLPLLLKLAPDLPVEALPELVAAARESGVSGFVATNTTVERAGLVSLTPESREPGGLSGVPLRGMALSFVERLAVTAGPDLPVIGAGGIFTAADVDDFRAAGARMVQVYTALVYAGPALVPKLLQRG